MDEVDINRAKVATFALAKPKLAITLRKNPSILSTKSNATQNTYIEKPPREGTRWGKNWLKDANARKGRALAYQVIVLRESAINFEW